LPNLATVGNFPDNPLPALTPQAFTLEDGWKVSTTDQVPDAPALRRQVVEGSQLYCVTGHLAGPATQLAGYAGMSAALNTTRAATSYSNWVEAQAALLSPRMALVHRDRQTAPDLLRFIEAKLIQGLGTGPATIVMLNTHTSAQVCANRLTRSDVLSGQAVAGVLVELIWRELFDYRCNPWPVPASNTREQAVRIIQRAGRAVDTEEIVAELRRIGHPSVGQTLDYSVRRDLRIREPLRGTPRVVSEWRRRGPVFWAIDLPKTKALRGYDAAHPRSRRSAEVA
jgi:hypothetical protein